MLAITTTPLALVICPEERTIFYHVPKAAGFSLSGTVLRAGANCTVIGGVLAGGVDPMHVTPHQLIAWHDRGDLLPFTDYHTDRQRIPLATFDAHGALQSPAWASFAAVRCPYMRVLSAYEQRVSRGVGYESVFDGCSSSSNAREDDPHACTVPQPGFEHFLRWLEVRLATSSWEAEPRLVHFRPMTDYTHALSPSRLPALSRMLKVEALRETLPRVVDELLAPRFARDTTWTLDHKHAGSAGAGGDARRRLCQRARGCTDDELPMLLRETAHTAATIAITNRLYARDFELLDYHRLQPPGAEHPMRSPAATSVGVHETDDRPHDGSIAAARMPGEHAPPAVCAGVRDATCSYRPGNAVCAYRPGGSCVLYPLPPLAHTPPGAPSSVAAFLVDAHGVTSACHAHDRSNSCGLASAEPRHGCRCS